MICTGGQLRPPVFGLHACRRRGGQDGRKDCDTPGGGGGYSRHSRAVPPAGQRFGSDAAGVFLRGPAGGGRDPQGHPCRRRGFPAGDARRRSCRLCAGRLRGLDAGVQLRFAPPLCAAGGSGRGRGRARAGRRQRAFGRRQALGTQPALGVLRAERAGPERERYPAV